MESGEGAEEKEQPQMQLQQATEALKKSAPEGGEKPSKRKMKTPYQLEILQETYAVETYPTETVRAELSAKTGLSDRQLQMWFCHRRLKDRKFPPTKRQRTEEEPLPSTPLPSVFPSQNDRLSSESGGVGLSSSPFSGGLGSNGESRRPVSRVAPIVSRIGADMSAIGRRYYDLGFPPSAPTQPTMAEMRILASVESQLGEPLRQDGPVLGVEFDPLPPGAFGAPIAEMPLQQKQPMHPYDDNIFERYDTKPMKAATFLSTADHLLASSSSGKRKLTASVPHMGHPQMGHKALPEYQFLPEQPSVRSETHDRVSQAHYYDSIDGSNAKAGRQHNFPSMSMDSDDPPHSNTLPIPASDCQFGMHQIAGVENQYVSSDQRSARDDDFSRSERKQKSDEARIAKEVEAHEKRIKKELEKQDTLRRKREEQMRREMERHDRERRKEEQRMLREKLREEERLQREQRRENERREKFLLKESQRAEKLRQKEELRHEKEAARQKAATERATARRIAREYMELIEDERLELMEIAAMNKGLSSICSLDSDTLQQLDSFRSMLQAFPPSSVKLRRPFGAQPWVDSDENIANVLMVWKFLITFADVLGIWPFTLDEFVQSLHDYDSRLLGEIHVSLLKSIIKDIEDVAKPPAITVGASQSNSANSGGRHPQIIEGAYAWGFNIRSWQHHLNYLTWSEILRQFALSAGFGPQLKKKNVEHTYFQDENEGIDGEDVISTLRNGSAVENAVALMHERGYTHRRRPRHRLTPGTVKFAAFHVLSLEGSRGLTILEAADKIQRSGLRDLTTSKTPEASIAAALSRDTKLFERTAPSTYCVRSPFRKDPAEADALLSAAREKIHIFQSALSDSEEAKKDTEDVDDAERDEDSEGDAGDDPEVDDTGIDPNLNKNGPFRSEPKDPRTLNSVDKVKGSREIGATLQTSIRNVEPEADDTGIDPNLDKNGPFRREPKDPRTLSSVDKVKGVREIGATPQTSIINVEKICLIPSSDNAKTVGSGVSEFTETNSKFLEAVNVNMEETEIDESNFGEPWVQGLSEGDYSELSVEERLSALVALIGVAIEGNSIQVVLEERLEAATALKKQMWAEAQLDKRRFREEYSNRLQGTFGEYKAEIAQMNGAREGSQTPHGNVDKANDGNFEPINNEQFIEQNQVNMGYMPMGQELTNTDALSIQQCGYAAEKSRSQLKSFIGYKAELLYVYRSLPLGQDRRRNRYWLFSTSSSPNDPGSGRIFLESKDGHWRLIDSEEAFDTLVAALDTRGIRESHLHSMLQRIEIIYKEAIKRRKNVINSTKSFEDHAKLRASRMMSSSDCSMEIDSPSSSLCRLTPEDSKNLTSLKIQLGSSQLEKDSALVRYQDFLNWMWKECYDSHILCSMKYGKKRCPELLHSCGSCFESFFAEESHCSSCHKTFKTFQNSDALFSEHVALCEQKRKIDTDWKVQFADSTLPMGIRLLKALLSMIEAAIPAEALQTFWLDSYRKSWAVKLHSSASAEELFQVLTLLEYAVKPNFLSSNFRTTAELLSSSQGVASTISSQSGAVTVLPWVPDTSAAVALRLLDLDFSVSYMLNQKLESRKESEGYHIRLPSHSTVVNMQEVDPLGTPEQVDYLTGWLDSGSRQRGRGRGSRGRGGRGRGRGRGLSGGASSSRGNFMAENGVFEKATRKFTRRGRTRGRGGRKRGCQTVRPRQRSDGRVPTIDKRSIFGNLIPATSSSKQPIEDSPQSSGGEEWGIARVRKPYGEDDDISRGSESDDNGQVSGDDYDDQAADSPGVYDYSKSIGLTEDGSEEDGGDMGMDEDVEDDDLDGRSHDLDAYMDDDVDDMQDNPDDVEDGEGNRDEDDGATSYSSQYSD